MEFVEFVEFVEFWGFVEVFVESVEVFEGSVEFVEFVESGGFEGSVGGAERMFEGPKWPRNSSIEDSALPKCAFW